MTQIKQRWQDEEQFRAWMRSVAEEKARKRKQSPKTEPLPSVWAQGVTRGRELLEESPAQVARVLKMAREIAAEEFSFTGEQDGRRALAIYERRKSYYEGLTFALSGSKKKAAFVGARAAQTPKELVAAAS